MDREYKNNFTEADVLAALDMAELKHGRGGGRYILTQCPLHEDKHASAQIYTDDWFVKCHAGCLGGRFHITKAFPHLRKGGDFEAPKKAIVKRKGNMAEKKYKKVNLMRFWKSLPEIPSDHYFKSLPIETLNDLGWRWDERHNRYFIPYFSRSRSSIPFGQWRNLKGNVRFNFWKDAKPTMYGTWNLEPEDKIFLVEGCSDAAVLDYCCIPWIAAPSASSGELVKKMAAWCKENEVEIIFAGDNDDAGNKVREALDEVISYRVRQPKPPYKDWGDMYEAMGIEAVIDWCHAELYSDSVSVSSKEDEKSDIEKVLEVIPGAKVLEIVDEKEQKTSTISQSLF